MTGPAAVMAVDVGSASARAALIDGAGRILARAARPIQVHRPATDFAEHASDDIWAAVCGAARDARAAAGLAPEAVAGLAFDATCSLVLLDAAGRPVTVSPTGEDRWNVVMWADHRAIAEAEEITATGHRALDHVGGVMSPEMELPKLLWLKRHRPDAWRRTALALDLTDFLTWRATGRVAVSACTVTCKWAYLNHEARGWQDDLLAAVGLEDLAARAGLPERALPIATPVGPLSAAAAAELGLTPRCTVAVGLIDAHAGGVGVLGGETGDALDRRLALIGGTSSCHMAVSPAARPVPGVWGPYYGAMLPGTWLAEGGQSATGALLDHVLDWIAVGRDLGPDRHGAVTAMVEAGLARDGTRYATELLVVPDFHGNRSPLADPTARGIVHGLSLDASPDALAALYQATAVGIALGTRHIIDALNRAGWSIDHIHLTGGHVANPLLVRLYADATGCTVVLPEEPDGVLVGTAAVAAAGCGLHPDLTAAGRAMGRLGRRIAPDPAWRAHFDRRYAAFMRLLEQRREIAALL